MARLVSPLRLYFDDPGVRNLELVDNINHTENQIDRKSFGMNSEHICLEHNKVTNRGTDFNKFISRQRVF